jgi:hypothetical protein
MKRPQMRQRLSPDFHFKNSYKRRSAPPCKIKNGGTRSPSPTYQKRTPKPASQPLAQKTPSTRRAISKRTKSETYPDR